MDTDVIVAGGGPTGLLLARELGLAGVRTTVLERRERRSGQSKALGIHPRTAEILELRGLLGPLLAQDHGTPPVDHFAALPVPLDNTPWDTRHPRQTAVPQARIEELLEASLPEPVRVLRGRELTAFAQDPTGVTVTTDDGTTLRARHLVGCDGGRSTVRRLLGVAFPGTPGRRAMAIADVTLRLVPEEARPGGVRDVGAATRRRGTGVVLVPLPGGTHRLRFPCDLAARHSPVTEDEVRDVLAAAFGPDAELKELLHASRFTDASRQARQYRVGRVLLAGDAAHIHLPAGGQGLNLSLQDAFNLGWKLAATVRGRAPAGLLDTYHGERHPVGARVLVNTRAQGVLMNASDEGVAALRALLTEAFALPEANRWLSGMISGLDIRYAMPGAPAHPLLGARLPGLPPLPDGRGALCVAPGADSFADALAGRTARVTRHRLPALPASAALVRPDGHVCWATDTDDDAGLEQALGRWFGPPEPAVQERAVQERAVREPAAPERG